MSPNDPDRPAFITRVCSSRSLTISLQISFTLSWSIELLNAEVHALLANLASAAFRRSSRTGRLAANFLIRSLCSWRASSNSLKMSFDSRESGEAIALTQRSLIRSSNRRGMASGHRVPQFMWTFDRVHIVVRGYPRERHFAAARELRLRLLANKSYEEASLERCFSSILNRSADSIVLGV